MLTAAKLTAVLRDYIVNITTDTAFTLLYDPFLFVSRWVMMENSDILPFESNQTNCEHLDTAG